MLSLTLLGIILFSSYVELTESAYTVVKSNAECSSASTYGLSRKTSVKTLAECAEAASNAGVNLFVSCQNSKFYCYIYTKTQSSTTCATKYNAFKCNVYRVTADAASPTVVLKNLARGKPTSQSTTVHGGVPGRAVDGNTNTNWGGNSCSHTAYSGPQWWRVDLEQKARVVKVVIYNRQDCCSDRLNNVQVTVGDSSDGKGNAVCGKYGTASGKRVLEITCSKPLHGRYVTVSTPTPMMTLCEVEVMGDSRAMSLPSGPAYTIVKSNAECSSASTYGLSRKTSVKTLAECAQTARNAGVNLFVSCQNSKFYCYIYTKTQSSTTCTTKHNGFKCNVYKVTGAASPTVGCVTTDKKKCVFPFKYKGVTYNGCSTANNGGKLWCSTENKADLNYNKWGNCDVNACKGTWASWGSWGSCSAECGNGEQKRTRKCEGRSACSGDDKESKTCKVKDCVKEVQTFGLCKSETSMIIATCVEITDLKVKCLFKGRSKTAPVTCPISSSKTHFVCKGVKGEEEVDCCDYSCS